MITIAFFPSKRDGFRFVADGEPGKIESKAPRPMRWELEMLAERFEGEYLEILIVVGSESSPQKVKLTEDVFAGGPITRVALPPPVRRQNWRRKLSAARNRGLKTETAWFRVRE